METIGQKLYAHPKCYVFTSEQQFLDKWDKFEPAEPSEDFVSNLHSKVERGYLVLQKAVYNEELELITEKVVDENQYLVDVIWRTNDAIFDQPYGWATYNVEPEEKLFQLWGF